MSYLLNSDYMSGTVSVSANGTVVTGTGTAWQLALFREGDWFIANGFTAIIDEVTSDTSVTLVSPWRGGELTNAPYRMRYMSEGSRISAQARALIDLIGSSGNLQALGGLTGQAEYLPMFTGAGTMTVISKAELISGVNFDAQVDTLAERDAYDLEPAGFSVLVSDVGDGRSAIYSKLSATSGDWSDPAYVTGPTGATGSPWDDWQGPWQTATAYAELAGVENDGSSYICVNAHTSDATSEPGVGASWNAYWDLVAAKGADGAGTGDVIGPNGGVSDSEIAVFSGATGKTIKGSGIIPGTNGTSLIETETPQEAFPLVVYGNSIDRDKLSLELSGAIARTPIEYGAKGDVDANLLPAEAFDLSSWPASSFTVATSGTDAYGETAYLFTEGAIAANHYIRRINTGISANQDMTVSVLVKAGTRDEIRLLARDPANSTNSVWVYFDLTAQTTSTPAVGGDGAGYSAEIVDVGGGWFQCLLFCRPTTSAASSTDIIIYSAEGVNSNTPGSGTIYLSGPQIALGDVTSSPYGTDDAAAMNAAIQGTPVNGVLDGLGKTYRIDSTLVFRSDIIFTNLTIDASKMTLGDTLFQAVGSVSVTTPLTSSATKGATSIAVADASGIFENDLLILSSNGVWASNTSVTLSEMVRVKSISGNTLTLTTPLDYAYSTGNSAQIEKPEFMDNITFYRVNAIGGGVGLDHRGTLFNYASRLRIIDCDFSDFDVLNIAVYRSAFVSLDRVRMDRAFKAGLAYGVSISHGCHWVTVRECSGERVRHAVTIGGTRVNRFITVENCNAFGNLDAGFDCHPAGDHIVFANNYVVIDPNAGGQMDGIIAQGGNTKLTGNTVLGAKGTGVFHQCLVDYGQHSSVMADNIIKGASSAFYGANVTAQGAALLKSVIISNNSIEGYAGGVKLHALSGDIRGFTISGNSYYEPALGLAALILVEADTTKQCSFGTIVGNNGRIAPTGAGGVLLIADTAGNIQYVNVNANSIFDGDYGVQCVNTNWINVNGNQFPGATTPVLLVGADSAQSNNLP